MSTRTDSIDLTLFGLSTIVLTEALYAFRGTRLQGPAGEKMEYISVREAAEKWGLSTRRIQILCTGGRIDGADRIGNMWVIPKGAEKPKDARIRSGKYIKQKLEKQEK